MQLTLRTGSRHIALLLLFDLKLLIEGGNLQVYMYCVHAQKTALGAPRTHFRECKISKFPGGMLPIPPHIICIVFALGPPNPLGSLVA